MNLKNFLLYNRYDTNAPRFPTSQQKYDEMVRLFNKYNLDYKDLNREQIQVLEDLIENKENIEEKLQPLKKVCNYSLNVVGGCLRDLLLNQAEKINDYDIIVSRNYADEKKIIELAHTLKIPVNVECEEFNQIKQFRIAAKKEQMNTKNIQYEDTDEKILMESLKADYYFSKVVEHLVKDLPNIYHFSAKNVKEEYANYHIMSINQFTGTRDRKVDLIVTDYCEMSFLSTFDIELCKAYVDLGYIKTKEDIIDNIIVNGSMLEDIENKHFSINAIKFSTDNIDYFFNKHLVKLKEKFPEYTVNVINTKPMEQLTVEEKNRLIYANNLKMNFMFPEKNIHIKRLKI